MFLWVNHYELWCNLDLRVKAIQLHEFAVEVMLCFALNQQYKWTLPLMASFSSKVLKKCPRSCFQTLSFNTFTTFYNLLLVFFFKIWLYFTTFRCLRWSFSRPWTRVFLSSIVLELQAAHGCASEHKQFAFGSMWDFEILSFKRTIWNSEMTFKFYMFFNESMSFLSMLSRPGWVSKVNDSESQSRRRWPCWAHVARLC